MCFQVIAVPNILNHVSNLPFSALSCLTTLSKVWGIVGNFPPLPKSLQIQDFFIPMKHFGEDKSMELAEFSFLVWGAPSAFEYCLWKADENPKLLSVAPGFSSLSNWYPVTVLLQLENHRKWRELQWKRDTNSAALFLMFKSSLLLHFLHCKFRF